MVRGLFTTDERKRMMDEFYLLIRDCTKPGIEVSEKKLIAEYSFRTGLSPLKIKEYLNILIDSGRITRTVNGIQAK